MPPEAVAAVAGEGAEGGPAAGSASREMASPRRVNLAGKPPEAGVIDEIYLENFMCHRKLKVSLCRNVNFIHGQNGSGKSAILAAIQICLGAGARRTHRARNLKELVRKDSNCSHAKVRVTILNGSGDDSYHHEIYGDKIRIERTIALRGGFNGYKLYDVNGQMKSDKKKDLDDLLDKLNIQVDNPVAILDQEEAKKFLTGKSEDKYNFFMKATELERIDRTYANCIDTLAELRSQSHRAGQDLEALEKNKERCKKDWEKHRELEKLVKKIDLLGEHFAWATYKAADQEHAGVVSLLQQAKDKLEKKSQEIKKEEEEASKPEEESARRQAKLDGLADEAQKQTSLKQQLEAEMKRASEPLRAIQRQIRTLEKEIREIAKKKQAAEARLQQRREEIAKRAGSAETDEARRAAALKQAQDDLEAAQQERAELQQQSSDANREYEELDPLIRQAKQNTKEVRNRHHAIEAQMRNLSADTGSNLLAQFGPRCANVARKVEQYKSRFSGPVIGPIGSHLQIVPGKERFAGIAELALGRGNMDKFIVTNDQDRVLFMRIRKECGCEGDCSAIQVQLHPRYNIRSPPAEGIETVASVLNITHDIVFNCLVDIANIDVTALAASRNESEQKLLIEDTDGSYRVKGQMKIVYFLPNGDLWRVNQGLMSVISNEKQLRQTIGVDRTAALAQAEKDVQQVQAELTKLQREENRLEFQHTEKHKEWNAKRRAIAHCTKKIDQLEAKIDEIKAETEKSANFDSDTSEQEQDIADAQREIDAVKDNIAELNHELEQKSPEAGQIRAQLEEVTARNEKVLAEMKKAEEEMTKYFDQMNRLQERIEKKRSRLKEIEGIISEQQQKAEKIYEDRQRFMEKARILSYRRQVREEYEEQRKEAGESVGLSAQTSFTPSDPTADELDEIEPLETDHPAEWYEARLERARNKLRDERERRSVSDQDAAACFQKYSQAKKQLDDKFKQMDTIKSALSKLEADMKERKTRWRQFRACIAETTDKKFDEMMNLRGSSGELVFDHDKKSLNLVVQKESGDANSQQKDVKALSGGERSFATIAMLLALGEMLETPFRILDEFDVFLDPVMRKLTIQALVHVGKKMEHRQFIFITPQDVSSVKSDPMLKILKLDPPARNAVAGLSQQTLDFPRSQ